MNQPVMLFRKIIAVYCEKRKDRNEYTLWIS